MKKLSSHCRHGFTLLDLVLTAAILSVVAGLAFPSFYEPRRLENEACAEDLLQMIASVEQIWMKEKHAFVTFPRLSEPFDLSRSVSYPLLPFFSPNDHGEFRYGGYLFSMEVQEKGLNFLAHPVLSGYSGTKEFQISVSASMPE